MNNKCLLLCLICWSFGQLHADDFRGFKYFNAPGVIGAHQIQWSPIGITDRGYNFGIAFTLVGDSETSPNFIWVKKDTQDFVEINSISAVNRVINDAFGGKTTEQKVNNKMAIDAVRHCLSAYVASEGTTGL